MPYTTNVAGTTITAAWGNANVRDQNVTPFASASARSSAITSPIQGMVSARTDENVIEFYDGAAWVPVGWKPIAQSTLGGTATSVSFSSIPATYKHLMLSYSVRGDAVLSNIDINVQLNGDTGANYSWAEIVFTVIGGATFNPAGASSVTSMRMGNAPAANFGTASTFGGGFMTFLEYSNANSITKLIQNQSSYMDSGNAGSARLRHGGWKPAGATAITQITLLASNNNFTANSVFRLYGFGAA